MDGRVMQLLIVEDSADDAKLFLAELERKGHAPAHQRVESKADFLAALQQRPWDAVISDYVLPQFSGPEALHLLRQQGGDTPFIMVSGIYGEEEAVTMMKAGANDYIMKGNLSRLVPALERELEAAQDRHRRKRAEGAMQFLAAIVESSEDAIYGKNLDSLIVSWNPAAERLFGYSAEEIIGRSTVALFPQSRRDEMLDILAGIRRGDLVGGQETERLHKSGRIIPVSVTVSPVRNAAGEIIGASSIARDISQQKQAEYERQQLIEELTAAAKQVKTLTGLLPICATCKRIRDDKGYWQQVETYITKRSGVIFSHGICPACVEAYERQFEFKSQE
jgi:PAS domain S-box-containing protein